MHRINLFLLLLVYRLINAFTIKTFFQPDEFYQALEPAHKLVFGYGYITWEWQACLRSLLHPLVYSLGYYVVSQVVPHSDTSIILSPRIVGALISATTDYYLYFFAKQYTLSSSVAQWTLALLLCNPFTWFFSTRAFSSTFETMLMVAALARWPWRPRPSYIPAVSFTLAVGLGVLSCIVRPTNTILWIGFGSELLVSWRTTIARKARLLIRCIVIACLVVSATAVGDTIFYGKPTFPLYNFVQFNVIHNLLAFYGEAPWHFYLLQALPVMLLMYVPLLGYAITGLRQYKSQLFRVAVLVLVAMLLVRHKEIRFVYPLQPLFMVMCAQAAHTAYAKNPRWARIAIGVTIVCHILAGYIVSCVNERGVMRVIEQLRHDPVVSAGFLMPCHSTPWHSHMHRRHANVWFLTCEPPLHLAGEELDAIRRYRDESDRFYDDPVRFLRENFAPHGAPNVEMDKKYQWPNKIMLFESCDRKVVTYLQDGGYKQCERIFNSLWHWDPRRSGDLLVYCQSHPTS